MRHRLSVRALVSAAIVPLGLAFDSSIESRRDPLSGTEHEYRPPGPEDSRGPCPGLNALANHGYIPRSGRAVNILQLVGGALEGLGVSPETSGFVALVGYGSSRNLLSLGFDLEDLARHGLLIEHDCSFSREDYDVGENNNFRPKLWKVVLDVIGKKKTTSGFDMGKAKGARIRDEKTRNPHTAYGLRAAAFSGVEVGMILTALGGLEPPPTSYVRSMFEHERIPSHLGWKKHILADNAIFALAVGAESLLGDPDLSHVGEVVIDSPADLLEALVGIGQQADSKDKGGIPQVIGKDKKNQSSKKGGGRTTRHRTTHRTHRETHSSSSHKRSDFFARLTELVTSMGYNATGVEKMESLLGESQLHF